MTRLHNIWCNVPLSIKARRILENETRGSLITYSEGPYYSVLPIQVSHKDFARCDIAFGRPSLLDCVRRGALQWMHISTASVADYQAERIKKLLSRRRVIVTNSSSVFCRPVAEYVLGMILGLERNILPYCRHNYVQGSRVETITNSLHAQTVLMVGFGAIGHELAKLLRPFGCKLYGVRRRPEKHPFVKVFSAMQSDLPWQQADHIVVMLPAGDTTVNFINEHILRTLKSTACIYNVGRGVTLDHNALACALQRNRLRAACLDVTEPEPLPPTSPLWHIPTCYITPHIAGARSDSDVALVKTFILNYNAFRDGKPLPDKVLL